MSDPITIRVADVVGGPLCVSVDDGQRVHNKIGSLLAEGRKVVLSFDQVEIVIAAFLSAAVGQLYGEFCEVQIERLLEVRDLQAEDGPLLVSVVRNAKAYYADPRAFDEAWKEELDSIETVQLMETYYETQNRQHCHRKLSGVPQT